MPKKAGAFLVAMGVVLILSALLLFACNLREDIRAGQEAESLLTDVQAVIAAQAAPPTAAPSVPASTEPAQETTGPTEPPPDPEMPTVYLGGYDYLGYLALPTLGLELPVMASWDYPRLKISPCRQFGSTRTDDLVIAAHNYGTHFGRLKELSPGDAVTFTDMEGVVNSYQVASIQTLSPDDVDAVQNSGYPLVLYTCTPGGQTRVTVFCTRSDH